MGSSLMTVEELADLLGKAPKTLYQWRYLGEGPPGFKVGGHIRYRREDVDAWLESQRGDRQPHDVGA